MEAYKIPFIVIDGLDASGKTTQAYRLVTFLKDQGKSVCLRIHPSNDNSLGIQAKRFLQAKGKNAHFASALFYMLDVIRSVLRYSWRDEDYIIFVRYLLGTAYLPSPMDRIAYHFFATLVPRPETTLFIDIKPQTAQDRITQRIRDAREMFETPEKLTKIRQRGLELASLGKWQIVDGGRHPAEIELSVRNLLKLSC